MADVNDAPMLTINVDEGPAYGAAILAAVAAGLHKDVGSACDAVIREVDRVTPEAAAVADYGRWFREYQAAYRALAPGFKRAAALLG
jgi:xylulokinase